MGNYGAANMVVAVNPYSVLERGSIRNDVCWP
jgi:hypothetical protein